MEMSLHDNQMQQTKSARVRVARASQVIQVSGP